MTDTQPNGALRTVPLSEISVAEGFNPRSEFERHELDRLADSIGRDGLLQPLVVTAEGNGGYRLIAGERRYRAARDAGLTEVPVVVREVADDGDDLALALVENIARADLSPVDEARAFKRLLGAGLTRKGVAERIGLAQKRVTERLEILEIPEALHARVADGTIPPGAVKPLARLAGIHPGLAELAVRRVTEEPEHEWAEGPSWSDLAAEPIAVVTSDYAERQDELPEGVFEDNRSYTIDRFTLSDKARKDLANVCELIGTEPETFPVRFGAEEVEQAEQLGAAHRSSRGYCALIVGQDVADQLAADYVARCLRVQRRDERQRRESERDQAGRSDENAGGASSPEGEPDAEERRKREREEQRERKRQATAYNHELGAACVKHLSRLKLDERVVKLLACVDLHGELQRIAARGARYGFPGWTEETQLKNGRSKVEYLSPTEAGERARQFIAGAKSAAEIAGRCVALIAMARYADEGAVAQSQRAFYSIDVYGPGLPWSHDVVDLIDELSAERLPDHLTREQREERARRREAEVERERQQAEREQLVTDALERVDGLNPDARAELLADVEERLGDLSHQAWPLRQRIAELAEPEASDEGEDTGEDEGSEQAA